MSNCINVLAMTTKSLYVAVKNVQIVDNGQLERAEGEQAHDASALSARLPSGDQQEEKSSSLSKKDHFLIRSVSATVIVGMDDVLAQSADSNNPFVGSLKSQQQANSSAVSITPPRTPLSRLLPKIKIRTESGNSDVKSMRSRSMQATSPERAKSRVLCCFVGS